MAGTDTSRGMNFQYACTIKYLIAFPSHSNWQVIQMEGDEDIEDVTIFDREGEIVLRAQIKQKTDPYQWQPNELKKVLVAFSNCEDSSVTDYVFTYSGAEGRELTKILPILSKLKHKGFQNLDITEQKILHAKFGEKVVGFLKFVEGRLTLKKRGTWQDIRHGDLRKLGKLLSRHSPLPIQDDVEEAIYNELFLQVAEKTESNLRFNRQLNRNEIYHLLQLSPDSLSDKFIVPSIPLSRWIPYLENIKVNFQNWHTSSELEELLQWDISSVPINSYLRFKPQFKPALFSESREEKRNEHVPELTLAQLLNTNTRFPVLIRGDAGAGKSTCLRFLCYQTARKSIKKLSDSTVSNDFVVPVIIYLRRYGRSNLRELIYHHFRSSQLLIKQSQFEEVLITTRLFLLLDGLDEVKPERKADLLGEIASWSETYSSHKLIITTRKQPALSTVEKFDYYEIQPLNRDAIWTFTQSYLSNNAYAFWTLLEERGLSDFIRIPLLLTLCLIIFKLGHATFDSLTDIYQQILEQYKRSWELPKRSVRINNPFDWVILEKSLSFLAYHMIADDFGYTIDRDSALNLLTQLVGEQLIKQHFWSSHKHNIADLLDQLLIHNLLEISNNEISFWHASFRDFFAAIFIANMESPLEKATECASEQNWSLVTAFLNGLLPNAIELRKILVKASLDNAPSLDANWPIETLRLMGNETTPDLIQIIAKTSDQYSILEAAEVLGKRDFKGKSILDDVLEIIFRIDRIYDYGYNPKEFGDFFPDPDWLDYDILNRLYENTLLELVTENIGTAKEFLADLHGYLDRIFESNSERELDSWLIIRGIFTVEDFHRQFQNGKLDEQSIKDFCNNTALSTSLPYLDAILSLTENHIIRLEANLGIQCLTRQRQEY